MAFQKLFTVFAALLGLAVFVGNVHVAKADDVKAQVYQVPDSPDAQSDAADTDGNTAPGSDEQSTDNGNAAPDDGYTPPPEENDSVPETSPATGAHE